jgi:hypothetical protein
LRISRLQVAQGLAALPLSRNAVAQDPDARPRAGLQRPAVITEDQIVIAAELTTASPDSGTSSR